MPLVFCLEAVDGASLGDMVQNAEEDHKNILQKMMKIRWILPAVLLLTAMNIHAQLSEPRQTLLFDEYWKFHLGNASDPAKDFNFRVADIFSKSGNAKNTAIDPNFLDEDWASVQLPHDWVVELPFVNSDNPDVMSHGYKPVGGLFPETSIGWYRKHFSVDPVDKGKRFSIRFDGIFRDAKVWINGFYLGDNESGYMGVTYDLTDFLNFDKDNVIVVRVDASQYEGWFYEGAGIYRHVWMNRLDALHMADDVYIQTETREKSAYVSIESTIINNEAVAADCAIITYIIDRDGNKVADATDQQFSVQKNGEELLMQHAKINDARLWSLEDPYLYRAVITVKRNNKIVDKLVTRFGIRTIHFDSEKGFYLNGQNVKIYGVCNHQDHAGLGVAVPDDIVYYRLHLLKEMGVNAYRTCHNPPTPELLDACDSLGILVLDETRLLNSGPVYLRQFENMIIRDRNHPSIFLWSIGNEEGYIQKTPIGRNIAETFLATQKRLDPLRTSTYAADLPNVYEGINEVIPIRGFNYRQFAVADYHKSHPAQPIIGTEMGSTVTTRGIYEKDTVRCYVPDQDITAPWWASKAEVWWTLCSNQPAWMGGFVWTGFDYRGEPTPFHWPNVNSHFGIMDVCGFPKNIYYYYQSWWTNKDVLHISPHWNWHGKEGRPIKVWVNTNAENVQLFLNGKNLGKKMMPRNSHLEWDVPYHPGILKAVAWKNGKKIVSQVETTGNPVKIILNPDRKNFQSNGRDAVVVNITALDTKNREVPDAESLVKFKIIGDAKIIGVGNGDPSSHEPDKCSGPQWQRKLFNGKCQVIVQAGKTPGAITIEATADGLIAGTAILDVKK
jgi:beta-galactosidase